MARGHKITIYRKGGSILMHRGFPGGGESAEELFIKHTKDQERYVEEGNTLGEFWLIDENGDLLSWDSEGLIRSIA